MCYSKMAADAGGHNSDNPNIAKLVRELLIVGRNLENLSTAKPEISQDPNIGFLKVFGEVVSAVGLLFKNDDVEQKMQHLLAPLQSYTSLMYYFLFIKTMVESMQKIIEVDLKEHKHRLERVNKELVRIAIQAALIGIQLEELGKSIQDIIRGKDSKKAEDLQIFDLRYNMVSLSLANCLTDMELVKQKIDAWLCSIKAYKKKTKIILIIGGIFGAALVIMAPFAVGCLCLFAVYGVMEMIGVAAVAAVPVGAAATLIQQKVNKPANVIQQYYNNQECDWQQLDGTLKIMKLRLETLRQSRISA